ncbi:hypothetical protein Q5752_007081 [Cryptotrichosporon argae]
MCGIVALHSLSGALPTTLPHGAGTRAISAALSASLERIAHRGPDAASTHMSADARTALGHVRLAINDLSAAGCQPLVSACGRVSAVVNGEIYDFDAFRADLAAEGYVFRSTSDSEIVLALYMKHGLDFVARLRGEFAIAIHDARIGRFVALRDRYGIKPMFWRLARLRSADGEKEVLMCAAEMKAFLELGWEAEWDVGALADGGWGQDTRTVFKGVRKVRPGHYLIAQNGVVEERPYWDASYPDKRTPDARPTAELVLALRAHLLDAVRVRLRADVPVGIYLSGGIDSSAIAGMAAHLVKQGVSMGSGKDKHAVCCFSIGFDVGEFDESAIAARTAAHLGVRFIKHLASPDSLAASFADAVYHIEHHAHDLNFVGKYALSAVPRAEGYKVVLTGEGADEHFGGYPLFLPDFAREPDWSRVGVRDGQIGEDGQGAQAELSDDERARLVNRLTDITKRSYDLIGGTSEYFSSARPLGLTLPASMAGFTPPVSLFRPETLLTPPDPVETIAANLSGAARAAIEQAWHPLNGAMYAWTKGHLANQFLSCLGDRVEMAHSVEARTPFLDHKLTEFVNGLPVSLKVRHTRSAQADAGDGPDGQAEDVWTEKWILREAVRPFVTDEIYARKKHAYAAPTTYARDGPVGRLLAGLVTRARVGQLGFVQWSEVEHAWGVAFGQGDGRKAGHSVDTAEVHETTSGHADVDGKRQEVDDALDTGVRTRAFRTLLIVACWVVLAERFAVRPVQ